MLSNAVTSVSKECLAFFAKKIIHRSVIDLATCRRALWKYGSSVPYSAATVTDIGEFDAKLMQVIERFFTLGTWKSMWRRIPLIVYDCRLTIPRGFETCRQIDSCGGPLPLYSQFSRFGGYGTPCDSVFSGCTAGLRLLDEGAQTFRIPTGTFYLRAVATEVNADGLTFIGGYDQDEAELFDVVTLALTNGSTTTTQQYTRLPQIQKAVTNNAVSLYAVDVTTGDATLIASYAPGETLPNYRQYSADGFGGDADSDPVVVTAICKLGFVTALAANDIIVPGHIGALKLGLMSIQFEDKVDGTNAGLYMGPNFPNQTGKMSGAIDLLDAELAELQAAEQPLFSVSSDYGCGGIRNVR